MSDDVNKGGSLFRMSLDLVMGTVYLALAGVVFYYKQFGTFELSGWIVYAMSGLLVVYGGFRVYMGINRYRNR